MRFEVTGVYGPNRERVAEVVADTAEDAAIKAVREGAVPLDFFRDGEPICWMPGIVPNDEVVVVESRADPSNSLTTNISVGCGDEDNPCVVTLVVRWLLPEGDRWTSPPNDD